MKKLLLSERAGTQVVDPHDIIYCEAQDCYSVFHLRDGRRQWVCKTLKEFEKKLDKRMFVRVHRKYIVNLHHVRKRNGKRITLSNNTVVEISFRKSGPFTKSWSTFIEGP